MPEKMIHEILPVGLLQCNCSILGDPSTGEAIVVDPGDDAEGILEVLRGHKLKVRAIVSTHTHIDHVGGLAALHRATSAPVLIHEEDLELYRHLDMQAQWLGVPTPAVVNIKDFVKEGDKLRWGNFAAHVLHTPGHTPGSISLVVQPETSVASVPGKPAPDSSSEPALLLAGDTLFQGSI
jgi:hydroxyacylglutathione hydrolase